MSSGTDVVAPVQHASERLNASERIAGPAAACSFHAKAKCCDLEASVMLQHMESKIQSSVRNFGEGAVYVLIEGGKEAAA